jgi:hypothetical protein
VVKKIAMYGTYEAKEPVKQRYWKRRIDGIRQRYWKKTKQTRKVVREGRYEFHGSGKDLYKAVVKALKTVPKRRFVDVSAEKFLKHPERYGIEGEWIDVIVES